MTVANKVWVKLFPSADTPGKAVLQIDDAGGPLAHAFLDETAINDLIDRMSAFRITMENIIPTELDPGSRLETIVDPLWRTRNGTKDAPFVLLVIRHPGLGWLSFGLPSNEARKLGKALINFADVTDSIS